MKKIIFLIISLMSMMFATTASAIQGEGTEQSPFLITTQAELETVSDFPTCHFKLENDIVLEGEWNALCDNGEGFSGVFDGNGYEISNLTTIVSQSSFEHDGIFAINSGIIKRLKVKTSGEGLNSKGYYVGGIAAINRENGIITQCSFEGEICYTTSHLVCNVGGISAWNSGLISECYSECVISFDTLRENSGIYASGLAGHNGNGGTIINCYSGLDIDASIKEGMITGIGPNATNCYFVGYISSDIPIGENSTTSFYDKTVTGIAGTKYGTPKTTIAMKMKKTYTDAGWDFENVWGIDADINDGYPYLLWEYENNASANAEIIGATATDSTLKFISEVYIEGEPEISAFGTTFIPLWLFESGSSDVATVEYNNDDYNIQNAQTYGATLTNIPESCKDMEIVGKSYIKTADGTYTWSKSKYASVNNTTLNELE